MKSRCRKVSGGCNFTRDGTDDIGSVVCVCECVCERARRGRIRPGVKLPNKTFYY